MKYLVEVKKGKDLKEGEEYFQYSQWHKYYTKLDDEEINLVSVDTYASNCCSKSNDVFATIDIAPDALASLINNFCSFDSTSLPVFTSTQQNKPVFRL